MEDVPCAEVRAGGVATRYRVAGRGPSALVLAASDDPAGVAVVETLSKRLRVLMPEVDTPGPDASACVASFLDGLGLAAVVVVGLGRFAGPALDFATSSPERVTQLVLMLSGPAGDADLASGLADALGRLLGAPTGGGPGGGARLEND